jgi:hypothetical protein
VKRLLTGAFLLALAAPARSQLSNLVVNVVTTAGAPVAGANVAALTFQNGQPLPSVSAIGVTNALGVVKFNGAGGLGSAALLTTGYSYVVVAGAPNFLPSIFGQFTNNPPGLTATAPTAAPATFTIALNPALGLGEIDAAVTGATPNSLIFGQLGLQAGGGAAAFAFARTDGLGAGTLSFLDVAFASAGVYNVGGFDPASNRSASASINLDLNALTTPLGSPPLNFTNAPPPASNINQAQQSVGGASLNGVVTDTSTPVSIAIPNAAITFTGQWTDQSTQTHRDDHYVRTDQNGVFQLYNLIPGVTYYTTLLTVCTQPNAQTNVCYQGVQSTALPQGYGAPPGPNDFLYTSTAAAMQVQFRLTAMSGVGNGTIAVYITDQFLTPLPQAGLTIGPDAQSWESPPIPSGNSTCSPATMISNPGLTNVNLSAATGYVLVTGLTTGNYQIQANAFATNSVFNTGNTSAYGNSSCPSSGTPTFRVTIDTNTTPDVKIFDAFGNILSNPSSITITVAVSTGGTGTVTGAVSFPSAVDLSLSPIIMSLSSNCGSNCANSGGYKILNSSAQPALSSYSITLSSALVYRFNVQSDYWGPIFPGGGSNSNDVQVDLTQSTTTSIPIQFVPAGRVVGYLHKPDGSIFVPANGQNIGVGLNGNGGSGSGGQVGSDGSFVISGVVPGNYAMNIRANNNNNGVNTTTPFPFTTSQPPPTVSVTAGRDAHADVYLANSVTVRPEIAISSLPALSIFTACSNSNDGDCPPENYGVFAFPQGTPFNTAVVASLINGNGSNGFAYSVVVGTASCSNSNSSGYLTQPGFCSGPLTVNGKSGSTYDFYVMRLGSFDSQNYAADARPYFTIETSSKNIVVSQQAVNDVAVNTQGSTTTVQDIFMNPPSSLGGVQQAVLAGTVTITNLITPRQFKQLGGNFNNFLQYLPIAWVYDSTGALKAFGVAIPPPIAFTAASNNQLKQSVTDGNYAQFNTLFSAAGLGLPGYEIRGLVAGETYSLVLTTPNYPPFKTTVTLGAAQSTTTVNVNFNLNPGSNLTGVVLSTASKGIPGAQVTIQAPGYQATTLTTDASGFWQLNGLGAGQYQILATAAGFAQQAKNVDVNGKSPVPVPAFVLTRSNASISGTVYTNNPICPAGVICSAFGKTALQGVSVLAYDDTLNVTNPSAVLPLYRGVTSSSGVYEIDGLQTGEIYKVFAQAPGYYVLNQTTLTVSGTVTGFDFAMTPKPLDVNIFGHPAAPNYEFQVTNFQQFSGGHAWVSQSPFVKATSTDVSNSFMQRPDSQGNPQMLLDYPLASLTAGTLYVLHVEAQPNNPNLPLVIKEAPFGLSLPNNTCQNIDQALIGDSSGVNAQGQPLNQVPLDISGGGNASGLALPPGGVIPLLSTSVPSMCMTNTDAAGSPQAAGVASVLKSTGAFASGVYKVTLSSVNYTAKGFNLTFAYNQAGSSLNDLAVYTFDTALNEWRSVPGLQTLNPVNGTITVNGLKSLASVLSVDSVAGNGAGSRLMALSDGRSYRPNAIPILPDDTGLFAVLRPSQLSTGSFSGSTIVVYNFPNPFNLQSKTVSLNTTASNACTGISSPQVTTSGTVIKFEVPAGVSGHGVIRVYTLSGRLVRDLDQGDVAGGTCTYTGWDGLNRSGQAVANGVYYGILTVGGSKASSGTFKMAVIK